MTIDTDKFSTAFLIDDDDRIRTSLARALTKRGFRVDSFSSAESFLEAYDPTQAGCLVLDYGMPGLNGLSELACSGRGTTAPWGLCVFTVIWMRSGRDVWW